MYLDEAKRQFEATHLATLEEIQPCTMEEMEALEQQIGRLPAAYREYLLWMGHGAGTFWRGTDAFYQSLPRLQVGAVELLNENSFEQVLPENAFVFLMHQGYQFLFFLLGGDEDPPVYYFSEGTGQHSFTQSFNAYSEFFLREIAGHAELRDEAAKHADSPNRWHYSTYPHAPNRPANDE
jgi:SMI1/KNR4 family protein SUKH-1